MNITIIGTGYVGLTTGTCLSELGHKVQCYDIDQNKIDQLNKGHCPIYEIGLPELITKNTKENKLKFTTNIQDAIKDTQAIFICVGTPPKEDGSPDLTYVETAIKEISNHLKHYAVIVEKSTVPVRTAEWMKTLFTKYLKTEFDIAVNPEFLREGTSVHDFLHPDRIVIGTETPKADKIMTQIYEKISAPIIHTNLNSAELIKHASNSFLAMKISYANLVAQLCDQTNSNITTVMEGVGMDKRIGKQFLAAGLGYGGFCFPKDLEGFITVLKKHNVNANLLTAVKEINETQRKNVLKTAEQMLNTLKGKTITVLGLAFKPNTDDVRLSPAILLIQELQQKGAKIKTHDPQATNNAKKILTNVEYYDSPYEAIKNTELLIIATDWQEYKELDPQKIKQHTTKIIDARNIYDPTQMKKAGFEYKSIGRP